MREGGLTESQAGVVIIPGNDPILIRGDPFDQVPGGSLLASAQYITPALDPALQTSAGSIVDNQVSAASKWSDWSFGNNQSVFGGGTDPNVGDFFSRIFAGYE